MTVGFGNVPVVNYKEALCLTVVEGASFILLAYNIRCVGNLITNIRVEGIKKAKKKRVMKNLSEKNEISDELAMKIDSYIEECYKIKEEFNIEENSAFISSLPNSIKKSFFRESNKKVFDHLPFFGNLSESTLMKLAEKIEMFVAHPDQILMKKNDKPMILILKQGSVAFCPNG